MGLVDGDTIVELGAASVLDVVLGAPGALREEGIRHAIEDVRLLCPAAPLLRNAFCVGWNYLKHFEEGQARRDASDHRAAGAPHVLHQGNGRRRRAPGSDRGPRSR